MSCDGKVRLSFLRDDTLDMLPKGDIPILITCTYVQNLTHKTQKTKNQKTLVIYHDIKNALKCTNFAALQEISTSFIISSWRFAKGAMLL